MPYGESAVLPAPAHVPLTFFQKVFETQEYVLNLCEDRWLKKARQCAA